jgi:hypothetical protein
LFFITNVVRVVRLKLNRELTQSRGVLVSSHSAVAAGLTEYGTDPFTPNEFEGSRIGEGFDIDPSTNRENPAAPRGLPRFNDTGSYT